MTANRRLSDEFGRLAAVCAAERPTLRRVLPGLGPRNHALVCLLVAVCFMHPVPMPGLSWALASVIVIAGARMALGLGPWLPDRLADRPMPGKTLAKVFGAFQKLALKTERLIRPRARFFTAHPWVTRLTGALLALCGLLILIPLPPPTNFPPAIAVLLLSIGTLEDDGLVLAAGYAAFAANVLLFGALLWASWSAALAFLAR